MVLVDNILYKALSRSSQAAADMGLFAAKIIG